MKLLDHQGLRERGIPYDRSHLWRLCKKGEFPKPVPLGANRIAWLESEIEAWIKKRVAARDSRGRPMLLRGAASRARNSENG